MSPTNPLYEVDVRSEFFPLETRIYVSLLTIPALKDEINGLGSVRNRALYSQGCSHGGYERSHKPLPIVWLYKRTAADLATLIFHSDQRAEAIRSFQWQPFEAEGTTKSGHRPWQLRVEQGLWAFSTDNFQHYVRSLRPDLAEWITMAGVDNGYQLLLSRPVTLDQSP